MDEGVARARPACQGCDRAATAPPGDPHLPADLVWSGVQAAGSGGSSPSTFEGGFAMGASRGAASNRAVHGLPVPLVTLGYSPALVAQQPFERPLIPTGLAPQASLAAERGRKPGLRAV